MIVAAYARTMAGARRVIEERKQERRATLAAVSRAWIRRQEEEAEARQRAKMEAARSRPRPPTTTSEMIGMVAFWHGVTSEDIMSASRRAGIIDARYDAIAAVALNCHHLGSPIRLAQLGRIFNRDHTTVLFALRTRGIRNVSVPRAVVEYIEDEQTTIALVRLPDGRVVSVTSSVGKSLFRRRANAYAEANAEIRRFKLPHA